MSERVTTGDIAAFEDVLDLIIEQSDDFDLEHAAELKALLAGTTAKIAVVQSMLDTQLRKLMDGASRVITSGRAVEIERQTKKRPDWDKIRAKVIARSLVDDEGERWALPEDAVRETIEIMRALYVAPKTEPKTGGLKMLHCTLDDVSVEEHVGDKVVVK